MTAQLSTAAFEVSNWRPLARNTLVAFFSLTTPAGMLIHNCSYHRTAESRWISLPAEKYVKDGQVTYRPLIESSSKEAKQRFQQQAVKAIDRHLNGTELGER